MQGRRAYALRSLARISTRPCIKGFILRIQAPIQLNQDEEDAKRHRELIEQDRAKLIKREEKRVARYELRLTQTRQEGSIRRARLRLEFAKKRLSEVRITGSVVKRSR